MPRRESRISFSLIEMMVAVAVIGSAVVGLTQALSQTNESSRRVEQRAVAVTLAEIKLTEFAGVNQAMEAQTGKFDAPYDGYDWSATVKPTEVQGLFQLTLDVGWQGRQSHRALHVQTLVPRR